MSDAIQQQIESIENQVALAEKGYQAFRRMYAQTNARPEKRKYTSRLGILRVAVIIVMVAGSIVSANHTIPTFMGETTSLIVGIAAFFMSELALAAFAYIGVMRHYRETQQEPKSLKTLVSLGVIVPFIVMAAANISHEFALQKIALPGFIAIGITLAISLSAPFMSYIAGEVFAMFEVIDRVDQEKHDTVYAELIEKWEDKCRAAWGREKVNYGGKIRVEAMPIQVLSNGQSNGSNGYPLDNQYGNVQIHPSKSSIGHTKKPQASRDARKYFEDHPDELAADDPNPAIALGIAGRSTVYKVMADMRREQDL